MSPMLKQPGWSETNTWVSPMSSSVSATLRAPSDDADVLLRLRVEMTLPEIRPDGLNLRRSRADSPALAAGLREGDRVIAIGGQEIATDLDTAAVQRAGRGHTPDGPMTLRIRRGGEPEPTGISASMT
ncbi:MAG: PDZ domain-containing protein [Chloroflexi bacterium]|nr:MAG: PDZ domain-containing protein [Chloroflexota bacterium]